MTNPVKPGLQGGFGACFAHPLVQFLEFWSSGQNVKRTGWFSGWQARRTQPDACPGTSGQLCANRARNAPMTTLATASGLVLSLFPVPNPGDVVSCAGIASRWLVIPPAAVPSFCTSRLAVNAVPPGGQWGKVFFYIAHEEKWPVPTVSSQQLAGRFPCHTGESRNHNITAAFGAEETAATPAKCNAL